MTIDTSKEAVERLANAARSAEYRQFPHGVFADTFDALATERDAQTARADAAEAREQALLSSYDAERKALVENAAMRAEVARLKDENERLREALTTKRDYVKDVATGALVNVSPVSLVGMAKDDLDMINAALQRKAVE